MKYDHHCRELLAIFLRKLKATPTRWTRIILSNVDAISSDISDGLLSTVMGISYAEIYIQFMQRCGLVKMQASRRWGTTKQIIDIMAWESFVAENKLQSNSFLGYNHLVLQVIGVGNVLLIFCVVVPNVVRHLPQ